MAHSDEWPPPFGETITQATAEAGVSLLTRSGCPDEPTVYIEAVARGADGQLSVTLAGGSGTAGKQIDIFLPQDQPQIRRLAAVAIHTDTVVGTGGTVTAYWGPAPADRINA